MARTLDSMSPPPAKRRQLSPPNLRKSFIPDSGDRGSPTKDLRPAEVPRSSDGQPRNRIDRYIPPYRPSSPPERPPTARRPPSRSPSPRPVRERSRSGLFRHDDDFQATPGFQNLTWIAPHLQAQHKADVEHPVSVHSEPVAVSGRVTENDSGGSPKTESGRVSFNGLKGVPIGPKRSVTMPTSGQSDPDTRFAPHDLIAVKQSPHIFIPCSCLPTKPSIGTHLHGCLKQHVESSLDICFDRLGWYISFEASDIGRERLNACYHDKHRTLLFRQYTLHMEAHPYGHRDPVRGPVESLLNDSQTNSQDGVERRFHGVSSQMNPDRVTLCPKKELYNKNGGLNQANITITNANQTSTEDESPTGDESMLQYPRSSLPLRVPGCQDRDDSSSISGFTGSDVSSSRRLKCHVCHTSTSLESDCLISCSSCPRRYHRRCHTQPAIPLELDQDHLWQCRRCVKKAIRSKSRLSKSSPERAPTSEASALPSEELLSKELRLNLSETLITPIHSNEASHTNIIGSAADSTVVLETDKVDTKSFQSTNNLLPLLRRVARDGDETHFDEANELVAQSFASQPPKFPGISSAMPLKLKLVPKKLSEIERTRSTGLGDTSSPPVPHRTARHTPTKETQITTVVEDDSSAKENTFLQEDKPRQWAGRGAGKEIIRAGRGMAPDPDTLVDAPESTIKRSNTANAHPSAPPPLAMEVPESPEESWRPAVLVPSIKSKQASTTIAEELPTNVPHSNDMLNAASGDGSIPQARRMKPGPTLVGRCQRCAKKIAYNPSGSNKLCSRCRSEASATSSNQAIMPLSADKVNTSQSSLHVSHTDSQDGINRINASSEKYSLGGTASHETENNAVKESNSTPANFSKTGVLSAPPPRACQTCRRVHRRCDHVARSAPIDSTAEDTVKPNDRESTPLNLGQSKDHLNFWSAMPTLATPSGEQDDVDSEIQTRAVSNGEEPGSIPELSDVEMASAGSQATATPVIPAPKRLSQRRPALSEHDLGDSFFRPKGSYEKLIGMALCSAPDHRLSGAGVAEWVAKNIPGYKLGEGKWESSLKATLTLKKQGYEGKPGLWKKIELTSNKFSQCEWELLPGEADRLLHWDPVLGRPVSPPQGWHTAQRTDQDTTMLDADSESRPNEAASKRNKRKVLTLKLRNGPPPSPNRQRGTLTNGQLLDASSEDEPLVRRRRSIVQTPILLENGHSIGSIEQPAADAMVTDRVVVDKSQSISQEKRPLANKQGGDERSMFSPSDHRSTLLDMIEMDAENLEYSTDNVLETWHDYGLSSNKQNDTIAKAKGRPTRKKRFGKQDPWTEIETREPLEESASNGRSPAKAISNHLNYELRYPWQAIEDKVVHVETIEELFNIPQNPMAIIHEGQLAYRDGTRNEDGSLPRAKVIYKTGYT